MEKTLLKASERKNFTKSGTRKNRKEGNIPGVFYSKSIKPLHTNVADRAIRSAGIYIQNSSHFTHGGRS